MPHPLCSVFVTETDIRVLDNMNTENNILPRYLFASRFLDVASLLLTMAILIATAIQNT